MISLIAALSLNNVIGQEGNLPWRLPADHEHFWQTAGGHIFVMGRGSYEVEEPLLSDRLNLILTSQPERIAESAIIKTATSIEAALNVLPKDEEVFILGGGQIFAEAIHRADRMYLSLVETSVAGDAFFPEPNWAEWRLVSSSRRPPDEDNPLAFSVNIYDRRLPDKTS